MLNIPTASEIRNKISSDEWKSKVEEAIKKMYEQGEDSIVIEGTVPSKLKAELEREPYFFKVTYGDNHKNEYFTTISAKK